MNKQGWSKSELEPVFHGLKQTGITGREIARALKISPATVSKWRRGRAPIPAEIQVFLTLMLASQLDRLGDLYADWDRHLRPGISQRVQDWKLPEIVLGSGEAQPASVLRFVMAHDCSGFGGTQTELLQIWQQNQHPLFVIWPQHRVHSKEKVMQNALGITREGLKTALKIKEDYRARRPI